MIASPKAVAQNMKLSGPTAGRTVEVSNGNLHAALMSLNRLCNNNNIRGQSMDQRFHIRPTKYKQERKLVAKKKSFNKGITRLMKMVHEAKRRGY
ncbi:hypothetical protein BABINDRAFT_29897 [Babjeviella inositovora NRRL Y-12698]|uniref:Ribosomal protein S21 n=1 Tax=Babjeviella inositovora NRRL Y-12698 TaxID=984486 RepID=A0A1E3QZX0_9ASCO|nr:uncharacterized protein BABINDRAFT_29897 [Babjeviella inositovora NRRL Y-12698]ODQ83239.1 hypothetical protein BABINDRAFT_29897 [Babjeviella inositovora NRRL Y-12698]